MIPMYPERAEHVGDQPGEQQRPGHDPSAFIIAHAGLLGEPVDDTPGTQLNLPPPPPPPVEGVAELGEPEPLPIFDVEQFDNVRPHPEYDEDDIKSEEVMAALRIRQLADGIIGRAGYYGTTVVKNNGDTELRVELERAVANGRITFTARRIYIPDNGVTVSEDDSVAPAYTVLDVRHEGDDGVTTTYIYEAHPDGERCEREKVDSALIRNTDIVSTWHNLSDDEMERLEEAGTRYEAAVQEEAAFGINRTVVTVREAAYLRGLYVEAEPPVVSGVDIYSEATQAFISPVERTGEYVDPGLPAEFERFIRQEGGDVGRVAHREPASRSRMEVRFIRVLDHDGVIRPTAITTVVGSAGLLPTLLPGMADLPPQRRVMSMVNHAVRDGMLCVQISQAYLDDQDILGRVVGTEWVPSLNTSVQQLKLAVRKPTIWRPPVSPIA